jgi:N-acetylglucosaminyldiphosphoundecaprenol N-acetyl-beta-D-mannosaminyltransferase
MTQLLPQRNGPAQDRRRVSCAGVPIDPMTRQQAADDVIALATDLAASRARDARAVGAHVHLCNAYTLALADQVPALRAMLGRATRNYPDGKSVVWANRLTHGRDLPDERVYGPDLFLDVLDQGQAHGVTHYLLGGAPDTLTALHEQIALRFPHAQVVGTESPPFRPLTTDERDAQVQRIAESGAQIVWVGLGTPKQDWECAHLSADVPTVFVAVGAAFDFVAGHKQQAPEWMQRNGLEWAHRLGSEPRRLWRRYLFGNTRFVYAAARGARDSRG